jgi:hypothetical protein
MDPARLGDSALVCGQFLHHARILGLAAENGAPETRIYCRRIFELSLVAICYQDDINVFTSFGWSLINTAPEVGDVGVSDERIDRYWNCRSDLFRCERAPGVLLRMQRYQIINPPIGRPISVFGSCRSQALNESPIRLTTRTAIASWRPHSAFRASPIALNPHATPTSAISAIDTLRPISKNGTRASGFNRQIDSRKLPGKAIARRVIKQMRAPAAKKI